MAVLTGKTALVRGGSRGIGRAVALRLAADDALGWPLLASEAQMVRSAALDLPAIDPNRQRHDAIVRRAT